MKSQTDWAFAIGINDLMFHTYQHQPLGLDGPKPGMAMGPYGVHWQRNQTFWPMVRPYHDYIARCGQMLRQGVSVCDILYLTPEGAPHIFLPPEDAMTDTGMLRDKKGNGFDAVSPKILMDRARVENGRIVFQGGSSYRVLVLPLVETMTPELATKIGELIRDGAWVIGKPPVKSPSLVGFPKCDKLVKQLATDIWGDGAAPVQTDVRKLGNGSLIWGGDATAPGSADKLYPSYGSTVELLRQWGVAAIFESSGSLRWHQRRTGDRDIFFVSNREGRTTAATAIFRTDGSSPELWNPVDGTHRPLPVFSVRGALVEVPLRLEPQESCFVVFNRRAELAKQLLNGKNFSDDSTVAVLNGPYEVAFDPAWGGPAQPVVFAKLTDWKDHTNLAIKYYSGEAVYRKSFERPENLKDDDQAFLDLGVLHKLARVKLNGEDLGIVWTPPFRMSVSGKLKPGTNRLEITVVNTWANRLIGDQQPGDKDARQLRWENGMLGGQAQNAGRYTFTTSRDYNAKSTLQQSGLLGPVTLQTTSKLDLK
jgi:hypothetical protein